MPEYVCDRCGEQCDSNRHLINHMRKHTHPKSTQCTICGKMYGNRLYLFWEWGNFETSYLSGFICYLHRLKKWGNMKGHMQLHTNTQPHRCTICGKSYHYKGTLELHMHTHTGTRPFTCKHCGKGFSQKGVLTVSYFKSKCIWMVEAIYL